MRLTDINKNNGEVQELQAEILVILKINKLLFSEVDRYNSEQLVR